MMIIFIIKKAETVIRAGLDKSFAKLPDRTLLKIHLKSVIKIINGFDCNHKSRVIQ